MADRKKKTARNTSKPVAKTRVGTGLDEIFGKPGGSGEVEVVERSAIKGWTADEVANLYAKGKPTEKDVDRAAGMVGDLYAGIDYTEIKNKRDIYLLLTMIYRNRERLLEERYAKHFPQFIIEKCSKADGKPIPESTAYKDAKVVAFVTEWSIEHLLTDDVVSNLVDKLKVLAYKPSEIQKELIPQLEDLSVKDIKEAGGIKERVKWAESTNLSKVRHRMSDKTETVVVEIKDKTLRKDFYENVVTDLGRKKKKKIKG
ncbi:MAG: hypothetical protein GY866_35665, partial [Proteobacteria bacterium]|nr:hypothetical protein [Pseudomonadota bacterium]